MKKHMERVLALLLACALTIGDCVPSLAAQSESVQSETEQTVDETTVSDTETSVGEADDESDTADKTDAADTKDADTADTSDEDAVEEPASDDSEEAEKEQPEETEESSDSAKVSVQQADAGISVQDESTDITSGKVRDVTWTIDSEGCLTVSGTGDFLENGSIPWRIYAEQIKSAVVDVTGATSAASMFAGCINLENVDLSRFDTSNVTTMYSMFNMETDDEVNNKLTSINLSGFKTSNVTDMSEMFADCNSLHDLEIYRWDTSKVTDMSDMFSQCTNLRWLDAEDLDTSNVTDMSGMLAGCESLIDLDYFNLDTSSVTNMTAMFADCKALESLDLSSFDMKNVTAADDFLDGCEALEEIKTPVYLRVDIPLPPADDADPWYQPDGSVATNLPKNQKESISYWKNAVPVLSNDMVMTLSDGVRLRLFENLSNEGIQTLNCTPEKTGYYYLDGNDNVGSAVWYEKTDSGMQECDASVKIDWSDENNAEVMDYYYLEKGHTYQIQMVRWSSDDMTVSFNYSDSVLNPEIISLPADIQETLPADEEKYYKVTLAKNQKLFVGSKGDDETLYVAAEGYQRVEYQIGGYNWTELTAWDPGVFYLYYKPSQTERTIQIRSQMDGIFEKMPDTWDQEITLEAGESKYYEFTTSTVGDYMIQECEGLNITDLSMTGNINCYSNEQMSSTEMNTYKVYRLTETNDVYTIHFKLENVSEEAIQVYFQNDTDFGGTELTLDTAVSELQYNQPYFWFKAPEDGFYRVEFSSGSLEWSKKKSDKTRIMSADLTDKGIWLKKDQEIRIAPYLYGREYNVKMVKVVPSELSDNFTIQEGTKGIYQYTADADGRLYIDAEYVRLYGEQNEDYRYWDEPSYSRGEEKHYVDLKKGSTYYLYFDTTDGYGTAYGYVEKTSGITVFDYDYYNAFIKSGGSVSVNADGTVDVNQDKADWSLKDKVLNLLGQVTYAVKNASRFLDGNLYWRVKDVGEFAATDFYKLDKNSTNSEGTKADGDTVADGDVVLVKYEPEVVWVQKMTVTAPKTTAGVAEKVQLKATLDYGQTKYPPKEDSVIRWESSDLAVATVDAKTGLVTTRKAGKVTITAYADEALRTRENRPASEIVKASVALTVTGAPKSFTALKSWAKTSPIALKAKETKYLSYTTTTAGDYLFEVPQGVYVTDFTDTSNTHVTYQTVQFNGKTYACATFDGSKGAVFKFAVQNANSKALNLTPMTRWDMCGLAGSKLALGTTTLAEGTEEIPAYYYYSYTAAADGVYKIALSNEEIVRLICKKDGKKLTAAEDGYTVTLAKGEVIYMMLTGKGTGDDAATITLSQDENYTALTSVVKSNLATLKSGEKYIYVPTQSSTYTATAFTSWYAKEAVQTLQYTEGSNTVNWKYDQSTGNYTMSMVKGKVYVISYEKGADGPDTIQISVPGYGYATKATTFGLQNLTDANLNGNSTAARVSAAKYAVSGLNITATGTQKYVRNFAGALGAGDATRSGYFLAVRMKVQNAPFTGEGYIKLTYNGNTVTYKKSDLLLDSKKVYGYVDAYLDVTDLLNSDKTNTALTTATIRVSTDNRNNVKTYTLNLAKLAKETETKVGGTVSEAANAFGIRSSAPVITQSGDAKTAKAVYDSVSWSRAVNLTVGDEPKAANGNYLALKIAVPDSMTKLIKQGDVKVDFPFAEESTDVLAEDEEGTDSTEDPALKAAYKLSDDGTYVAVAIEANAAETLKDHQFTVTWGPTGKDQITQTVTVELADNCYMEMIPDEAVLPQAIAFNGLQTTMYVGKSQNIATTITKKYEADTVRLSYSSSNPSIISVNRVTGEVQALKAGTATVTVEAVDANLKKLTKAATIKVLNPTAVAGIKVTSIKDNRATVNWTKNTTGQKITVYAVPYKTEMGKTAAQWKSWIDKKLTSSADADKDMVAGWKTAETDKPSSVASLTVNDLTASTKYIFYVRNQATNVADATVSVGSISGQVTTSKVIFGDVRVNAVNGATALDTTVSVKNGMIVFKNTEDDTEIQQKFAATVQFNLYKTQDAESELMNSAAYTSVTFKSSNTNVVKVSKTVKNSKTGLLDAVLALGGQAGTAQITVTGKDASGTVRTSKAITFTVERTATALKAKTSTLTVGQSVALKNLIAYNVAGSTAQLDTSNIDYASVAAQLINTGCFVLTDETAETIDQDTKVTVSALLKNSKKVPTSGLTTKATFRMYTQDAAGNKKVTSTAAATIKINAMAAPVITSVSTTDDTAVLQFTPNSTVRDLTGEKYYYTVTVKDTVTGESAVLKSNDTSAPTSKFEATFAVASNSTAAKPVYTCKIWGLSANKKYQVTITARYAANSASSKATTFATKNRLLASENGSGMDIKYISLTELKTNTTSEGYDVPFGTGEVLTLENNETYIFMAQVSNLMRATETDKISWSISSGSTSSATIKAMSSTYEAQLKAVRTGTFTVTAKSTVTKQTLATFTVKVVPFQSGNGGTTSTQDTDDVSRPVAYLMTETPSPFKDDEKKTA